MSQLFPAIADFVIRGLQLMIFISVIMSWFRPNPRNPFVKGLHVIVDPVLHPIQSVLPTMAGMDFSPLVALLLLGFLQRLIVPGASLF